MERVRVRCRAMARKCSLPKTTDYMIPSGSREPEVRDVHVDHSPLPKRSSHRETFDPKWNDEFSWVIYLPSDQDNGPSMLCRLCRKYESS